MGFTYYSDFCLPDCIRITVTVHIILYVAKIPWHLCACRVKEIKRIDCLEQQTCNLLGDETGTTHSSLQSSE